MQMQMKYRLASSFSVVHHRSITLRQIQFAREFRGDKL
jgi:hypothetical protein